MSTTWWVCALILPGALVFGQTEEGPSFPASPEDGVLSSSFRRGAYSSSKDELPSLQSFSQIDKTHEVLKKTVRRQLEVCTDGQPSKSEQRKCLLAKDLNELLIPDTINAGLPDVARDLDSCVSIESPSFYWACSFTCEKWIYKRCEWGEWCNYAKRQCWRAGPSC